MEEIEFWISEDGDKVVLFSEGEAPELEELMSKLGDAHKGVCGFNGVCK